LLLNRYPRSSRGNNASKEATDKASEGNEVTDRDNAGSADNAVMDRVSDSVTGRGEINRNDGLRIVLMQSVCKSGWAPLTRSGRSWDPA